MNERLRTARRLLIIGGARSGKSTLAERVLAAEPSVDYVATSVPDPGDAEWASRIVRGAAWRSAVNADFLADVTARLGVDQPVDEPVDEPDAPAVAA